MSGYTTTNESGIGEMVQWVDVLVSKAWQLEFNPRNSQKAGRANQLHSSFPDFHKKNAHTHTNMFLKGN